MCVILKYSFDSTKLNLKFSRYLFLLTQFLHIIDIQSDLNKLIIENSDFFWINSRIDPKWIFWKFYAFWSSIRKLLKFCVLMLWLSYRYFIQLYQIDMEFHRDHHNSILIDMKRIFVHYGINMWSVHEVLNQHVLINCGWHQSSNSIKQLSKDHTVYILKLNQINAHPRD